MLSLLLLAPPLGVVTGYILTAIFIAHLSWQWAFYTQAVIAIVPVSLALIMIKGKYFDIERAIERRETIRDGGEIDEERLLLSQTGGTSEVVRRGSSRKDFGMSAVSGLNDKVCRNCTQGN